MRVKFSVVYLTVLALVASALLTAPKVMAAVLAGDFDGDGVADINDYTWLTQRNEATNDNVSKIMNDWGKTGDRRTSNTNNNNTTSPTPSLSPSPTATPSISLSDASLVAYFTFDEGSGIIQNQKPNGSSANLTPKGSPEYGQTGKKNKAVRTTFANSFCSNGGSGSVCKDANIYDFSGDFTIAMWVNVDSLASQTMVRKWELEKGAYAFSFAGTKFLGTLSHAWPDYLYGYDKTIYQYEPVSRSYRLGETTLAANQWQHLVFRRQASAKTYDVFVNGVAVTTQPGPITQANGSVAISEMRNDNQNSADPLRIGEFTGLIDEVAFYNKALTAAEVTKLYQSY